MRERDALVMRKVFPPELRHLMYLLTTDVKPVEKTVHFLTISRTKSLSSTDTTSHDILSQLIGILQREIILPELDMKGKLKKTTVFLAISNKLRHNVLMFLQTFKKADYYISWISFVRKQYAILDDWSKVIFRSGLELNDKLNTAVISTKKNKMKMTSCCSNFKNIRSFSADSKELCSPPSKRRKTDPVDDFFDGDDEIIEEEMISALDKTVNDLFEIASKTPPVEDMQCDMNERSSPFINNNRDAISILENDKDFEKLADLFLRCPLQELANLLEALSMASWDVGIVHNLIRTLIENDSLSFEKMKVVVYHGVTNSLRTLNGSVPRSIQQNITELMNLSKRITVHAVVLEILLFENFDKNHEDLINKLSPLLNNDDVTFLLDSSLKSKLNMDWNEAFLSALDQLLERISDLNEILLRTFVMKLSLVGSQFKKSLKFMKLLITVLRIDNGKNLHHIIQHLKPIVQQNETFLKKKVMNMLH